MERGSGRRRWRRLVLVAVGCAVAVATATIDRAGTAAARERGGPREVTRVAGSPLRGARPADDAPTRGRIAERLAAGPYTYLRVDTDRGEAWLATLGPGVAPGAAVAIHTLASRRDFVSRRLGRTFTSLHFAVITRDDEETTR